MSVSAFGSDRLICAHVLVCAGMSGPGDGAQLVRVYKTSIQKVECSMGLLNARACYLLVDDRGKQVAAWIGGER
jgi:hypothetical protein